VADDDQFRSTITKLWARLALAPPRFIEPGRVRLNVEGMGLDLHDDGRGNLVIEGVAASFSADPAQRARQTRKVLGTNMGLLLDNEAGVHASTLPGGETALSVRAAYAYSDARLDRLVKKIEDTVRTIEYYSAELKTMAVANNRSKASASTEAEPAVIFRP
jgi:hypothetical protein